MSEDDGAAAILSKLDFARHIKVSPGRISQYIKEGKLSGDAIVGDGRHARIRVELAKAQLRQSIDIGQRFANGLGTRLDASAPGGAQSIRTAVDPLEEQIKQERLEALRRDNRRRAEEEAARAGRYVLAQDARREMGKIVDQTLAEFEGFLSQIPDALAAGLNVSRRDAQHILRTGFGEWRERIAAKHANRAAELPDLIEDERDSSQAQDSSIDENDEMAEA